MQTHQRVRKFMLQPILETLDEDGNLKNEESLPVESLFHPYDVNEIILRIEREIYQRAREEQHR